MVGSQMQHAQRASGEKAALGRLDAARKDFLEIVRAKQNSPSTQFGGYSSMQEEEKT